MCLNTYLVFSCGAGVCGGGAAVEPSGLYLVLSLRRDWEVCLIKLPFPAEPGDAGLTSGEAAEGEWHTRTT